MFPPTTAAAKIVAELHMKKGKGIGQRHGQKWAGEQRTDMEQGMETESTATMEWKRNGNGMEQRMEQATASQTGTTAQKQTMEQGVETESTATTEWKRNGTWNGTGSSGTGSSNTDRNNGT